MCSTFETIDKTEEYFGIPLKIIIIKKRLSVFTGTEFSMYKVKFLGKHMSDSLFEFCMCSG